MCIWKGNTRVNSKILINAATKRKENEENVRYEKSEFMRSYLQIN